MSLQKSFSRDPFLFSQERNKSYRKVTSCVDGVIALASTVSHLRSGYDALGKGTPALRAQNQASIVLHSTAALTNCAVFLCCTQFQNIHQYNRHARNAVRAKTITITTTVSKSKTHNSFLIQQSIPNTPVRTQSERKRRLCHANKFLIQLCQRKASNQFLIHLCSNTD